MEISMREMESTIKEQTAQIGKLEYRSSCPSLPLLLWQLSDPSACAEIEVTSVRTADAATATLTKEKAVLEKRVHQLSTELQRAQMDLEKEKENVKVPITAPSTASKIARPVGSLSLPSFFFSPPYFPFLSAAFPFLYRLSRLSTLVAKSLRLPPYHRILHRPPQIHSSSLFSR
jgi:hypothetical protein